MKVIAQTGIIPYLIETIKGDNYEDFYCALQRLKEISLSNDRTLIVVLYN
jgi:hypothetical protein